MNYAILLSGGTGTRIEAEVPKQYVRAGGHMMVTYALMTLLDCERIDAVYIVAEHEWRELIAADAERAGYETHRILGYAIPGTNRQTSILNGMQEILRSVSGKVDVSVMDGEDTVLIHDAARPFVSARLLNRCYEAIEGNDGVMPALPMKDTVYLSEDGERVAGLMDREKIFAGQAPELFKFIPYYQANMTLMPDKIHRMKGATEPAFEYGMNIVMVKGDEENFKITTGTDLARYKQIKGA